VSRYLVSVTADIVVICGGNVLVINRKNPPFQDRWALPGGYMDEGETFLEAAIRELKEETGVSLKPWQLNKLTVRDDPERDPRGRVISQPFRVYLSKPPTVTPGDDATNFMWWPFRDSGLAFDHDLIVREAINAYV
jgi:8-oxo-dGTP diphosphatase